MTDKCDTVKSTLFRQVDGLALERSVRTLLFYLLRLPLGLRQVFFLVSFFAPFIRGCLLVILSLADRISLVKSGSVFYLFYLACDYRIGANRAARPAATAPYRRSERAGYAPLILV